jgi:hypothetical protein
VSSSTGPRVRILSFVNHAAPGNGHEEAIERAFEWGVDVIVAQGTGSDWGPYWLGSGTQVAANQAANVRAYVRAAVEHDVPFIFSFGIAGADPHLDECLAQFDRLCRTEGWQLEVAVIRSELSKEYLRDAVAAGARVTPVIDGAGLVPELGSAEIDATSHVVALIGPEPIMAALGKARNGVITGRALDIGLFMALPMMRGIPTAVAAHAGKLLECGGFALSPNDSSQPIWAEVMLDGFEVRGPNPNYQPTVRSMVGHTFYERSNPFIEENPGGVLDLSEATYTQTEQGVYCAGAKWIETPYQVMLEGARRVGFRAISVLGVRDSFLLSQVRAWSDNIENMIRTSDRFRDAVEGGTLTVQTRIYGLDGVLGELEPNKDVTGHEAAVILDVVAQDRRLAEEAAYFGFMRLFTSPYPGRKTTAGNAAAPFMPVVIPVSDVYEFSVQHLLPLADPITPVPMTVQAFPGWQPVQEEKPRCS